LYTESFWRDLQEGKNKCESEQQKNRCKGRITSTINTNRAETQFKFKYKE